MSAISVEEYKSSWVIQATHDTPKELVVESIGKERFETAINGIIDVCKEYKLSYYQAKLIIDIAIRALRNSMCVV